MGYLALDDFLKLPDDEKRERYAEMSSHDRFLWRVHYMPPSTEVVPGDPEEYSEEEREKNKKRFREILKQVGALKNE